MVLSVVEPPDVIVHEVRDSLLRHGELSRSNDGRERGSAANEIGIATGSVGPRTKVAVAIYFVLSPLFPLPINPGKTVLNLHNVIHSKKMLFDPFSS